MVVPANSWNHFSRGIAQAPPGQRSKTNQNAWFWFVFVFVCFLFRSFLSKDGEWGREGESEVLREVAVARMSHCFTSSAAGRCHVCRLHVGS